MDLLFFIFYIKFLFYNWVYVMAILFLSNCLQSNTEVYPDVLSPSGQTIVANFEAVKFIARNFLTRAGFKPRTPWVPGARSTTKPRQPP